MHYRARHVRDFGAGGIGGERDECGEAEYVSRDSGLAPLRDRAREEY